MFTKQTEISSLAKAKGAYGITYKALCGAVACPLLQNPGENNCRLNIKQSESVVFLKWFCLV